MIWTKSRKAIEVLLADSVRNHVKFHMTRYGRGLSYIMTRAWVTWDGKEIANMPNVGEKAGAFSRDQFEAAVEDYLASSIEAALNSDNPIVQAFALFDRRLGKRRLKKLRLDGAAHPLVRQFYGLRCKAEGLPEVDISPLQG